MEIEQHKALAAGCFNATWDLIDKTDRTQSEDFAMMHLAHASCYHWSQAGGTPLHEARGAWQVARVYALLGMGESALVHGKRSLAICLAQEIKDLDLAFGYEAVARAYSVQKDASNLAIYKALAQTACDAIEKQEDRTYVQGEIDQL